MAYEEAVFVVNSLQKQLSGLARGIVTALADSKISAYEGMAVGMQGMQVATSIMTLMKDAPPEIRQDILYVLEHGEMTVPV